MNAPAETAPAHADATSSAKQRLLRGVRSAALLGCVVAVSVSLHAWLLADDNPAIEPQIDEVRDRVAYRLGRGISLGTLVEFDLGTFTTCTYQQDLNSTLRLTLHVALAVHDDEADRFEDFLESHQHQMRDETLSIINRASTQDLLDPRLLEIKNAISGAANNLYGRHAVSSVAVSDFSLDEQ